MKAFDPERPDWIIVTVILVIGFLCVIVAGQLALRFAPNWQLAANMDSHLDPNSTFTAGGSDGPIGPVSSAILTRPAWWDVLLTPGAIFVTGTPVPAPTRTRLASATPTTIPSATNTARAVQSPTGTFIYIPPSRTPIPKATDVPPSPVIPTDTLMPPWNPTQTATDIFIATGTVTPTSTVTQTATGTMTATPTSTATLTMTATSTATFTPGPIPTDQTPGEIGTTPDGVVYILPAGGALTLVINLTANSDPDYDLVYYERQAPSGNGIFLDWMIVQISDGYSWYTVFNWGDNIADTNSNMDFNILPNPQIPPEGDQRDIPAASLYNGTGIAIDVDAIVPPGAYSYIRFIAPPGDADGQTEIDALDMLP